MYNANVINPAYVGTREGISIFGLYRNQWVGLEGAPKTVNLGVSTPLNDSKLGLGINYKNDHIGVMDENNLSIDVSYTIDLDQTYKLAFGLKGTANLLSINYSKLTIYEQNNPVIHSNINNQFSPNIGTGAYLYSDIAYFGLSVPELLKVDYYDDDKHTVMRSKPLVYIMGGYVFDIGSDMLLKPSFLTKIGNSSSPQVDLTANLLYLDKFTVGMAYRWKASISTLAGFQVNDKLFIGYTYDFTTTSLGRYNSGSHELFMRFDVLSNYSGSSKHKSKTKFF